MHGHIWYIIASPHIAGYPLGKNMHEERWISQFPVMEIGKIPSSQRDRGK